MSEVSLDQDLNADNQEQKSRVYSQDEVNDIVGKAKYHAAEKARREAESLRAIPQNDNASSHAMAQGGLTEEQVKQIALNATIEAQRNAAMQALKQKVINDFSAQAKRGTEKYADFDKKLEKLGSIDKIMDIVALVSELDNGEDVIYDLADNLEKVGSVKYLISDYGPQAARDTMKKYSDSIKKNEEAKASVKTKEPLSQFKAPIASTSNGASSVRDFRNHPSLR